MNHMYKSENDCLKEHLPSHGDEGNLLKEAKTSP